MAHDLATINGKIAMFCTGGRKAAWHQLGDRTPNAVNWKQARRLAGLDWEVEKVPTFARNPLGEVVTLNRWAIMRKSDGMELGSVGADYLPMQNATAFEFVDTLLEAEEGSHYESAGALGNGERIWVMAKVPQIIRIVGTDDEHVMYLLFATAHDGSMSTIGKLTSERVVCRNTLCAALRSGGAFFKVRHTQDAQRRLERAKQLMTGVGADVKLLEEKFNILATRQMTKDSIAAIMEHIFPVKDLDKAKTSTRRQNQIDEITALFEANDQNAIPQIRGSAYNLLNAFTEWTDHVRTARMTDGRKMYTPDQARAENALFGTGDRLKQEAFEAILKLTHGNPVHVMSRSFAVANNQAAG